MSNNHPEELGFLQIFVIFVIGATVCGIISGDPVKTIAGGLVCATLYALGHRLFR